MMRDAKPAEILYLHVYSSAHVIFDTIVQSEKCFVNPIIGLDILIGILSKITGLCHIFCFEKTKEITAVSVVLYVIKNHVHAFT